MKHLINISYDIPVDDIMISSKHSPYKSTINIPYEIIKELLLKATSTQALTETNTQRNSPDKGT